MDKILLGDLCLPASKNIKLASTDLIDYVDISSVDNQAKFITGYTTYEYQDAPSRARKSVSIGDVIISTVRPNLNAVAVFDITTPNTPVVSTGFCVLSCRDDVNPRYVYYACQSREFIRQLVSQATGASYPAVNDKIIRNALIPNYTLSSQNFICDQLDSVQNLINIKKKENKIFNETIKARFVEMFGDMLINPKDLPEQRLDSLADIVSGITKGRKVKTDELHEVPYMAVSNVKDGYIDWTTVKTIMATDVEIDQYRLMPGDVLMTEGGDPDKLGRGAVIHEPPKDCIHQNHIFRVRLKQDILLSVFMVQYLQQQKAKRYFLGCAKQTTGIASINMRQLSALPVLVPPLEEQEEFAAFVAQIDKSKSVNDRIIDRLQKTKASLMQEYFG